MAILEWQEEIAGDSADLVETEWDEDIVILAYAHQRRRPNYWRGRTKTI